MIELKNITKCFGQKTVLDAVNLTINQGEVVALIGPSGSGKSTLLRCINFLAQPTQGQVVIDGEVVTPKTALKLCRRMGMVFQLFHLFEHKNVLDNIIYAPIKILKEDRATAIYKAHKLLKQVGLSDKAHTYPAALSGGQKQRVAIARALAMEPEAMLFDEPTSALDPEMVKEVLDVIRALVHTGLTIVMVTHEMSFAKELADRVVFLDHGKILEITPPEEFFKAPQTTRAAQFLKQIL